MVRASNRHQNYFQLKYFGIDIGIDIGIGIGKKRSSSHPLPFAPSHDALNSKLETRNSKTRNDAVRISFSMPSVFSVVEFSLSASPSIRLIIESIHRAHPIHPVHPVIPSKIFFVNLHGHPFPLRPLPFAPSREALNS